MDPAVERAVADLARRQLGVVTHAQLLAAGVARRTLSRRISAGLLVPVGRHTVRMATHPPTWESEVLAACLDLDGVASHRTGSHLHGTSPGRCPVIDVTVPKG